MITKLEIPKVSKEYAEHIQTVFAHKDITPTTSIEQIMYEAGQRSVVEYIQRSIASITTISSDIEDINPAVSRIQFRSILYKLFHV